MPKSAHIEVQMHKYRLGRGVTDSYRFGIIYPDLTRFIGELLIEAF